MSSPAHQLGRGGLAFAETPLPIEPEQVAFREAPAPEPAADRASEPEAAQGVAYLYDDSIQLQRLAKLGRLSQIARTLSDELQAGWTVAEFASLQNRVLMLDQQREAWLQLPADSRGIEPDDAGARARFAWISERSRAMACVDAFKAEREMELEGYGVDDAGREAIAAFDPEPGWQIGGRDA